ncbi:MAG: hypothetical protein WCB12_15725 [Bryobacteraceae bacterium]
MIGRFPLGFPGILSFLFVIPGVVPVSFAQPVSSEASLSERTAVAQSFVSEKLSVWQKRLNLSDWKISVVLSPAQDLRPETLGNIHWHLYQKTAVIRILSPADYRLPAKQMLEDMEFTIVHELIHLQLAPLLVDFKRSDANHYEEEHVADYMAGALLQLDRTK